MKLIDPASYVVQAATKELELMGLSKTSLALPTRFAVSGCTRTFSQLSRQWLGYYPSVESVSLSISLTPTLVWEQVEVLE